MNNITIAPPLNLMFSVSSIEDETERPPFWHNWGYRGTELYFQDVFKKWKKHWEQWMCTEWDYFEGDGIQ
jgi:hypothetical protein